MNKIYKILLVGLLLAMLTIGTVASVNTEKNTKADKTIKENTNQELSSSTSQNIWMQVCCIEDTNILKWNSDTYNLFGNFL